MISLAQESMSFCPISFCFSVWPEEYSTHQWIFTMTRFPEAVRFSIFFCIFSISGFVSIVSIPIKANVFPRIFRKAISSYQKGLIHPERN